MGLDVLFEFVSEYGFMIIICYVYFVLLWFYFDCLVFIVGCS